MVVRKVDEPRLSRTENRLSRVLCKIQNEIAALRTAADYGLTSYQKIHKACDELENNLLYDIESVRNWMSEVLYEKEYNAEEKEEQDKNYTD